MKAILIALLLPLAASASAATFTVDNTFDPGSGTCDAAGCTLREAIDAANANFGPDVIEFNIPGTGVHTITPSSDLPDITEAVTIDGYTQPGASANTLTVGDNAVLLIEIEGSASVGLQVTGDGCTVRGLVINRCADVGILIAFADSTIVEGCFIGTDATGTVALSNGVGVTLSDVGAGTLIGGTTPAARNLISGNSTAGVLIFEFPSEIVIQGNYIGTDAAGTSALGNEDGVLVYAVSTNNFIGGTAPGAGNLISGNGKRGVYIRGSAFDDGSTTVQGNLIGTDVTGAAALGNSDGGVVLESAENTTIGGAIASAGNVISGNGVAGVSIQFNGLSGNQVQGNLIGTDLTGNTELGNVGPGILITEASNNTVGGTTAEGCNIISGNGGDGILINGTASGNTVQGNYIGTNITGTVALSNNTSGVAIDVASGNIIGGVTVAARNLISANGTNGVAIRGGAAANLVQGNYIGTDLSGNNALGNAGTGVAIVGSPSNTIGGPAPGAGNLLSGNSFGVQISAAGATGNVVQGNRIGTDATGFGGVPNATGILLFVDCLDTTVGGPGSAGNIIAFNLFGGLAVNPASFGGTIFGNSIFSNGGLGIDLAGGIEDGNLVTANDFPDSDTGANNLQNYPTIESITVSGSDRTVEGELASNPNTDYTLDFYSNRDVDLSGYGEGETYLGFRNVQTDAQGRVKFTFPLAAGSFGQFVTATATDPNGNTSEFSKASEIVPALSRFLNISTRIRVQTGDNVLIGGFIITGTEPKQVIVRAIGPSLGGQGVAGPLADPALELHYPDDTVVMNDNWRDTQEAEIIATGITPGNDKEAAIVATLEPGAYTAIVRGANGGSGVALVEAYDLAQSAGSELANVSTRGLVETGDNVMIGGIIVGPDSAPEGSILLRAIGPSLSEAGIINPLADPVLELHDGNGGLIVSNDNWKSTQQAAIEATGLAPNDAKESAILATLAPGSYTAIVFGAGGTTGVGLVEAYHLE